MPAQLSATRLNDFLGCRHRAALWLSGINLPEADNASLELLRSKGFEHEAAVLKRLEREHGPAVVIPTSAPMEMRLAMTDKALREGAPLIYQAALRHGSWIGLPDFLVRKALDGGGWRYEPEDAKLARDAKAEHLIQLNLYAALVREATGAPIAEGAIHVGGGREAQRFNLRQTRHITDHLMARFSHFAGLDVRETLPVKSQACTRCGYSTRCEAEWRADDSPVFIAGITGPQVVRYAENQSRTFDAIAGLDPVKPPKGVGAEPHAKLVHQARLQKRGRESGSPLVELLPLEPMRGFRLLPAPAAGDLFFDMEGDPLLPEGLEYLFGIYGPLDGCGHSSFLPIWAHDAPAEKIAFERLMTVFEEHFLTYPQARIYHYAPYEPVALKRLAQRYATKEAALDQMLREQRFVDLYRVARQAIRASTEGYSLKDLETIYWRKRQGEVTNAGDSIVEYERWRETGDPAILEAIVRYNEDDCVSTARMRDWLENLRPEGAGYDLSCAPDDHLSENEERIEQREAFELRRQTLAARIRALEAFDEPCRELMAELPWFHQRTQKPAWWAIFDRQTWSTEEMIEDIEGLGGLTLMSQTQDKRSFVATYRFPPQDSRLKAGASPKIAATTESAGTISAISMEDGQVTLRRGTAKGDFPTRCSLSPAGPLNQRALVDGLLDLLEGVAADAAFSPAWTTLLRREPPRLRGRSAGSIAAPDADLVGETIRAVRDLDHSTLIIQGPPGTGKTYTSARAIVALLQDGKRVGVSSNSHKAIHNLLEAVEKHASEIGFVFAGAKKSSRGDSETQFTGALIRNVDSSSEIDRHHHLVGGTAFHFASEAPNAYDYLFVDEAGQVSLGNLGAMMRCARNLVLVGDQMQLPQPVQGTHPGESGLSCLDYAMRGHATVPADRGILLNVTRRLHPELCAFISDAIYDRKLTAHPTTAKRRLVLGLEAHPLLAASGIKVLELEHEGCTQWSEAEAEVTLVLVNDLLRQHLAMGSATRPLTLDDIMIVSPFNMQVDLLRRRLPVGSRIGTVDKFQGQEAPVVIVSMATSFGGDAPRGTAFLFNRNRLNVAISRAQCLAIIVHGRRLLEVPTPSREDLPRMDLLVAAAASGTRPQTERLEGTARSGRLGHPAERAQTVEQS